MGDTETIQIAPSGDLSILLLGSADASNKGEKVNSEVREIAPNDVQKTFIVSSAVMRLASPVWNTMLDPQGHFMESCSNGEVHFAEDNAAALLLILRIAHLQFREVPEALDLHEMVSLAVVCDKYDTAGLVRPWIKQWEESLKKRSILVEAPGREEYLFFAWTFGDFSSYEKIAKRLIYNSTCDNEDQFFADGNLLGKNLPPGALDCIVEARKKTIVALLEACSKLVESYESDQMLCRAPADFRRPVSQEIREQCDTLVYGYLIKGLKRLSLWPGPVSPRDVQKSLTDLIHGLRSMTCFQLQTNGYTYHTDCVFMYDLQAKINSVELNVPSGIDDPLRTHMEEQAKKLGTVVR